MLLWERRVFLLLFEVIPLGTEQQMGNTAEFGRQQTAADKTNCGLCGDYVCCFIVIRRRPANYASLLMDASTGRALYEANADLPRLSGVADQDDDPLHVVEALDQGLRHPRPAVVHLGARIGAGADQANLRPGQRIVVEDAIFGLVTKSANDAAAVVAKRWSCSRRTLPGR